MNFSELAMRNLRNLGRWMWAWYLRGGNDEITAIDDKDYRGEEEKRRGRDLEFRAYHIKQDMRPVYKIQRGLRRKA